MAVNSDNVRVGVTGAVYVAPDGTALPVTATASLNAAFTELGYVSEDGVVQSIAQDITDIKAWQNGDVVRKVQTSHDLTYQMTFLEHHDEVLEEFYGNFVGGIVEVTGDQLPRRSWVVQVIDGSDQIRVVIPEGQITERGDVSYRNDEAVGYPITITAFPDSSGVKAYIYLAGPDS